MWEKILSYREILKIKGEEARRRGGNCDGRKGIDLSREMG
jgi:hypothetical protein